MSFFKKYNGTTHVGMMRLETLIWTLVYGGLLVVVVGVFMSRNREGSGFELMLGGGLLAGIGATLIYVRSRLREEK